MVRKVQQAGPQSRAAPMGDRQSSGRLAWGISMIQRMRSRQRVRVGPGRWTSAGAVVSLLAGMVLTFTTVGVVAAPVAAAAVPGTPGVPQPPTTIYEEDFENSGATPVQLNAYVGVNPVGQRYTASPFWLSAAACNGIVLDYAGVNEPACALNVPIKDLAYALGQLNRSAVPGQNHAVSAYT